MCDKGCNSPASRGQATTRQVKLVNNAIGRDGESAYEMAVRLGQFVGTEEEYLEWIQNVHVTFDDDDFAI